MKAIILGGGFGSRLGNLTKFKPKSLLKIKYKTILEWQIIQLKKNGIKDIFINTHYFHNQFKLSQKSLMKLGIKIHLKYQKRLNGTAGAVKIFEKELIKERYFFVIYGDILFKENFREIKRFHNSKNALCTIYVHYRKKSNSIVIFSKKNGEVLSFYERPSKEKNILSKDKIFENIGVNSGIYLLNSEIFKMIPPNEFVDFPKNIFPSLVQQKRIFAYPIKKKRFAIDTLERFNQACMYYYKNL